ncbi:MAG: hypothetical protein WCO66_02620 [Candidatus Absconditabacteria bacterium]
MGNIFAPQDSNADLSPGVLPSTGRLQKHCGQGFLHVLAASGIGIPQGEQINDSFIFFILKF